MIIRYVLIDPMIWGLRCRQEPDIIIISIAPTVYSNVLSTEKNPQTETSNFRCNNWRENISTWFEICGEGKHSGCGNIKLQIYYANIKRHPTVWLNYWDIVYCRRVAIWRVLDFVVDINCAEDLEEIQNDLHKRHRAEFQMQRDAGEDWKRYVHV